MARTISHKARQSRFSRATLNITGLSGHEKNELGMGEDEDIKEYLGERISKESKLHVFEKSKDGEKAWEPEETEDSDGPEDPSIEKSEGLDMIFAEMIEEVKAQETLRSISLCRALCSVAEDGKRSIRRAARKVQKEGNYKPIDVASKSLETYEEQRKLDTVFLEKMRLFLEQSRKDLGKVEQELSSAKVERVKCERKMKKIQDQLTVTKAGKIDREEQIEGFKGVLKERRKLLEELKAKYKEEVTKGNDYEGQLTSERQMAFQKQTKFADQVNLVEAQLRDAKERELTLTGHMTIQSEKLKVVDERKTQIEKELAHEVTQRLDVEVQLREAKERELTLLRHVTVQNETLKAVKKELAEEVIKNLEVEAQLRQAKERELTLKRHEAVQTDTLKAAEEVKTQIQRQLADEMTKKLDVEAQLRQAKEQELTLERQMADIQNQTQNAEEELKAKMGDQVEKEVALKLDAIAQLREANERELTLERHMTEVQNQTQNTVEEIWSTMENRMAEQAAQKLAVEAQLKEAKERELTWEDYMANVLNQTLSGVKEMKTQMETKIATEVAEKMRVEAQLRVAKERELTLERQIADIQNQARNAVEEIRSTMENLMAEQATQKLDVEAQLREANVRELNWESHMARVHNQTLNAVKEIRTEMESKITKEITEKIMFEAQLGVAKERKLTSESEVATIQKQTQIAVEEVNTEKRIVEAQLRDVKEREFLLKKHIAVQDQTLEEFRDQLLILKDERNNATIAFGVAMHSNSVSFYRANSSEAAALAEKMTGQLVDRMKRVEAAALAQQITSQVELANVHAERAFAELELNKVISDLKGGQDALVVSNSHSAAKGTGAVEAMKTKLTAQRNKKRKWKEISASIRNEGNSRLRIIEEAHRTELHEVNCRFRSTEEAYRRELHTLNCHLRSAEEAHRIELHEEKDKHLCQMCFLRPKDALLLPCRHQRCCYECLHRSFYFMPNNRTCPTCHSAVAQILQCIPA